MNGEKTVKHLPSQEIKSVCGQSCGRRPALLYTWRGVVLNYLVSQSVVFRSRSKRERERVHYRSSRFLPTRIAVNCHTHASWSNTSSWRLRTACQPPLTRGCLYGSDWKEGRWRWRCVLRRLAAGKKNPWMSSDVHSNNVQSHSHTKRGAHAYVKKLLLLLPLLKKKTFTFSCTLFSSKK